MTNEPSEYKYFPANPGEEASGNQRSRGILRQAAGQQEETAVRKKEVGRGQGVQQNAGIYRRIQGSYSSSSKKDQKLNYAFLKVNSW